MRIELLDSTFLLPSLHRFLADEGFLAVESESGLEVLAPEAGSAAEAESIISSAAHRWAALQGVGLRVSPVSDRLAHPAPIVPHEGRTDARRQPMVSIGLPVFNGARHLADAVESLLRQTYADFELIVSDNGSTDETLAIAEDFARHDERVVVLKSVVNRGAAWNHNHVLAAAHGLYFKWASHDDMYARRYLERSVETLERAPSSVSLVYPRAVLVGLNGDVLSEPERALMYRLAIPSAAYGMMRTDVVRRAGGFPDRWTDRFELLGALGQLGELWEIPEPMLLRRVHPRRGGTTRSSRAALARWWSASARSHFLHRSPKRLPPNVPPVRDWANVHDAVRSAVWAVAPEYVQHVRILVEPDLKIPFERQALETILVNLISNAVRYGAPPITVTTTTGERTVITVEDEGRGVSETFEPMLFEPFARSVRSRHDSGGLGLGLAVARLTANELGAALTHEHSARGARFQLVLAANEPSRARQPLARWGRRLRRHAQTDMLTLAGS